MPYPSREDLPAAAKKLPLAAQNVWRSSFNAADREGKTEAQCFKLAWAAVAKSGYVKSPSGAWKKSRKDQ